jgi:hypothetical protein
MSTTNPDLVRQVTSEKRLLGDKAYLVERLRGSTLDEVRASADALLANAETRDAAKAVDGPAGTQSTGWFDKHPAAWTGW